MVTAASAAMHNLGQCVEGAGVRVDSLVLEPLAAAEAVVDPEELRHGAVLCDIGGGTTDLSVYVDGAVVHTAVLPVGGVHMTRDLVIALRVPQPSAERAKRDHGHAIPSMVDAEEVVDLDAFGSEGDEERAAAPARRGAAGALRGALRDGCAPRCTAAPSRSCSRPASSSPAAAASLGGIELLAEDVIGPPRAHRPTPAPRRAL